jgi:hypothetical protein
MRISDVYGAVLDGGWRIGPELPAQHRHLLVGGRRVLMELAYTTARGL